jgi:hypothetical protein
VPVFTRRPTAAENLQGAEQMIGGVPYTAMRNGIFAHPTVAEGLTFLLRSTPAPPR